MDRTRGNDNNSSAAITLEFQRVLQWLSEFTLSAPGREQALALSAFPSRERLSEELRRVTEARTLLSYEEAFPFQGFDDLSSLLHQAAKAGAYLFPDQFLSLLNFLMMIHKTAAFMAGLEERYPLLRALTGRITPIGSLEKAIARIIDRDGIVKDGASKELAVLRHRITSLENDIEKKLRGFMAQAVRNGWAQEDSLAVRQGRPVIPLQESRRNQIKGLVLDQSASGSTVYLEPLEVVELRNRLFQTRQEESREIERLLRELTDLMRPDLPVLEENYRAALDLDLVLAKGKFSLQINGEPAEIPEEQILDIREGRHPLLLRRMGRERVIPLDLQLGGEVRTLIITGPNAGGKTVALKTAGLLSLMQAHGLHLPVGPGTSVPLFSSVFADIGDRQSIEQDLSTFSSHIESIKEILNRVNDHSLVLLDEIGSATDPDEGAALAETIIRRLNRIGALTMVTTHIGALKVFAHDEDGVENGSMVFDQESLRPTYHLETGLPGSSYAFEISRRLGLDESLVQEACDLLGEDKNRSERLILHLEEELRRARKLRREAELKNSELGGLINLYRERADDLRKKGDARQAALLAETEEALKQANRTVENLVREIREEQAAEAVIQRAKAEIKEQKKRAQRLRTKPAPRPTAQLEKGDWVRWPGHGGFGEVIGKEDKQGRILVQWDDFRLRIPLQELEKSDKAPRKPSATVNRIEVESTATNELDIRGLTGLEAVDRVEKYLAEVRLSGFQQVRIIHGKGGGVLRRQVQEMLRSHPLVASQRLGNWNEGDTGVTIVELK